MATATRCELNRYPAQFAPTPLVPVRLTPASPLIWCKLEFLNPSGSTKDRIARYILENALANGRLKRGGLVIEASSGSTSIAMALACAQLGLRFTAVMPETVSNERMLMIRAYGGEIRLTAKAQGVAGSLAEAERLGRESHAFLPRQFSNPENALAHQYGTAREILSDIPGGRVDAVVSGVGTGGTLVGLYLGCSRLSLRPRAFLARPVAGSHGHDVECCSFSCRIPGVVECLSTVFRPSLFDHLETIEVEDEQAISVTRELIAMGFPVGPSSGLNFCAAMAAAERLPAGGHVVTVLPDRMERYFTTELFAPYRAI